MTWKDGRRYEGYFQDGLQHGNGKYINKNGEEVVGEWDKGKFLKNGSQ